LLLQSPVCLSMAPATLDRGRPSPAPRPAGPPPAQARKRSGIPHSPSPPRTPPSLSLTSFICTCCTRSDHIHATRTQAPPPPGIFPVTAPHCAVSLFVYILSDRGAALSARTKRREKGAGARISGGRTRTLVLLIRSRGAGDSRNSAGKGRGESGSRPAAPSVWAAGGCMRLQRKPVEADWQAVQVEQGFGWSPPWIPLVAACCCCRP
jgi:hypothetical protein